jgi:sulfate permease, SulP family
MAQAVEVRTGKPVAARDVPDLRGDATRQPYDAALATDRDVIVYRISGAFFFGAAATVAAALDRIGEHPRAFVIDFSAVSVIDSTAAATIEGFVRKARRNDTLVYISGAEPGTRRMLLMHGVRPPQVHFAAKIESAMAAARARIKAQASAGRMAASNG